MIIRLKKCHFDPNITKFHTFWSKFVKKPTFFSLKLYIESNNSTHNDSQPLSQCLGATSLKSDCF